MMAPSPAPITVAVAQMCSRQDLEHNLATAEDLVLRATDRGARLVVLPENFTFIGGLRRKLEIAEALSEERPGPIVSRMMKLADRSGAFLLLGGIPIVSDEPDRFYNTALMLAPAGRVVAVYRKIHLFDVDIPSGATFKESGYVVPGDRAVTCDLLRLRLGLSICYDLRFPALYEALSRAGAQVLAVPAAFTLHTGKDHWLPLLRARAIENQCYVLAANQLGHHMEGRTSYGKSCIIDPWGGVLALAPDREATLAIADIDLEYLEQIRRELPSLKHRRPFEGP